MAIRCGRGGHTHETVAQVRACYQVETDPAGAVRAMEVEPERQEEPKPTDAQMRFVKALLNQQKREFLPGLKTLSKRSASGIIQALKAHDIDPQYFGPQSAPYCEAAQCEKSATYSVRSKVRRDSAKLCDSHMANHRAEDLSGQFSYTPLSTPAESAKTSDGFDTESLEDGFYVRNDVVYKVVVAIHGTGRKYAKSLNMETGEWEMASGAVHKLRPEHKMTLTRALEVARAVALNPESRLYGRCFRCGRTLTREESIDRMMGSWCAGQFEE